MQEAIWRDRKGLSGRHWAIPFSESIDEHLFELTAPLERAILTTGHAVIRIDWLVRRGFLLFQGQATPYNALQIRFTLLLSISTLSKGTCLSQCVRNIFHHALVRNAGHNC